jgi:hypothetical protein
MTKELTANPFQNGMAITPNQSGAMVEIEQSRSVAEAQAAIAIAKRFPRNQIECMDKILNACTRQSLAESALYTYFRGGTDITGPSIRLAEAIAQAWGNLDFGIRELEQKNGASTVEAYAWDMESNTRQTKIFQVKHWRSTKKGGYQLSDPRDIYEHIANNAARRLRACILGVIPGDVVEAAVNQCNLTLKTKADVTPERIANLLEKFSAFGVTKKQIEERIQRRIDAITPALMVSLGKIYNSLKDGMSAPADWFTPGESAKTDKKGTDGLKDKLKGQKKADKKTEPTPLEKYAALSESDPGGILAALPQGDQSDLYKPKKLPGNGNGEHSAQQKDASNHVEKPETVAEKFARLVSEKGDGELASMVPGYLAHCASKTAKTENQVKAKAVDSFDSFWEHFGIWAAKAQEGENAAGESTDTGSQAEKPESDQERWDNHFRQKWVNLRKPGFADFVHKNAADFRQSSDELKAEAREKWVSFYPAINPPKCLGAEKSTAQKVADEAMAGAACNQVDENLANLSEYKEYLDAEEIDPTMASEAKMKVFGQNREPRNRIELEQILKAFNRMVDEKSGGPAL